MNLATAISEAFTLWESLWRPVSKVDGKLIAIWVSQMEGITPEQFSKAADEAMRTCKFWPNPAEIRDLIPETKQSALPAYYNEFKALTMPNEPPITPEQKKEVIDSMKTEGGKKLLLTVLYGDEEGRIPRKEA